MEDIREKQRELEEELQERDSDLRRRQVASEQAVQAALARVWKFSNMFSLSCSHGIHFNAAQADYTRASKLELVAQFCCH